MAAIRYKEHLGWYVITLKLRETMESRLPKKSTYGSKIVPDYEPRPSNSEWVISIEKKLAQGRRENMPGLWVKLSIYRIPRYLKNGKDKAWVPQIVSLGPYHHGDKHLRHMEQHKWRCLHRILESSGQGIALYLDSMKKVERRARACYEGRISMSRDKFVEMTVLDGCFVIEMFQGFVKGFEKLGYPLNDPVFSMRESILQIQRDMLMLENQIPLFILDRLLGLQLGDPNQKERVAELVLQFFRTLIKHPFEGGLGFIWEIPKFYPRDNEHYSKRLEFNPFHKHGKVHCLEVFRRSLLHYGSQGLERPTTKYWSQGQTRLTFYLSKLREARIQIRLKDPARSWGDIQFKNGILGIPFIEINEGTRSLFLNLIAFEQSHFNCSHYVTSYVIFMHSLINSPEDALHLRDCGIIKHCLGSDAEVANLFQRLCQEVAFDPRDSYLSHLAKDLEAYYYFKINSLDFDIPDGICPILAFLWGILRAFLTRKWNATITYKWNAWKAILKNKYFDSPWSIISLIAAFVLLVLTCI